MKTRGILFFIYNFMCISGGNNANRLEKLREGIVDYEKIRILKEQAAKSQDKKILGLMQQLEEHLKTFLAEKNFEPHKISEEVSKGRKIVDELSEQLSRR